MKPVKINLASICLLCLCAIFYTDAHAENYYLGYHLRTGLVSATSTGDYNASFSEPMALEGQLSFGQKNNSLYMIRSTFSYNPEFGQIKYMHMGAGQRFYYKAQIKSIYAEDNDGSYINIRPSNSYYAGWDFGISQLHIVTINESISAQATLLEYGITLGYNYRISDSLSAEAVASFSKTFPISSINVDTTITRFLIGINMF